MRAMLGGGAEVVVRRGRLTIRGLAPIPALRRGLRLHPDDADDPYAFRIDLSEVGLPTCPVVFSRGPAGGATALHLGLSPVSLRRRPDSRNPRAWAGGALALGAAALAVRRRGAARARRR
jgi:hypothetical protein